MSEKDRLSLAQALAYALGSVSARRILTWCMVLSFAAVFMAARLTGLLENEVSSSRSFLISAVENADLSVRRINALIATGNFWTDEGGREIEKTGAILEEYREEFALTDFPEQHKLLADAVRAAEDGLHELCDGYSSARRDQMDAIYVSQVSTLNRTLSSIETSWEAVFPEEQAPSLEPLRSIPRLPETANADALPAAEELLARQMRAEMQTGEEAVR